MQKRQHTKNSEFSQQGILYVAQRERETNNQRQKQLRARQRGDSKTICILKYHLLVVEILVTMSELCVYVCVVYACVFFLILARISRM